MEKINKDKYTNLVNGQYNISLLLTYYETKRNVIKSHNAILLEKKKEGIHYRETNPESRPR